MSAIDSDKNKWPDPKDYGLPFVEITPIRAKAEPEKTAEEKPLAEPEVVAAKKGKKTAPVHHEPKEGEEEAVKTFESIIQTLESSPVEIKPLIEKKSASWVWVVAFIGLGIVSLIIWQIQSNLNSADLKTEVKPTAAENREEPPSLTEMTPESTPAEQNQNPVNQDSINTGGISNANISKPAESGTTIADIATGKLIRVENKSERPQYFIIVGSLPNEGMALEEANQYFGRSPEIYLISPFDGGKNYRLALSKFDSFKMAATKLEEIKSQYTEELWILKY